MEGVVVAYIIGVLFPGYCSIIRVGRNNQHVTQGSRLLGRVHNDHALYYISSQALGGKCILSMRHLSAVG
jgi:hypothetical protein